MTLPVNIILLFLIEAVFSAWMVLLIPVMAALCFAGSAVFTRSVQSTPEEGYDVAPADAVAAGARDKQRPETDEEDDLPRYGPWLLSRATLTSAAGGSDFHAALALESRMFCSATAEGSDFDAALAPHSRIVRPASVLL